MLPNEDDGHENAFILRDLWKPSSLAIGSDPTQRAHLGPLIEPAAWSRDSLILSTPYLGPAQPDAFHYARVATDPEPISKGSELNAPLVHLDERLDDHDPWLDGAHDPPPLERSIPRSWEAFNRAALTTPSTRLSELGPKYLSLALGNYDRGTRNGSVDSNAFVYKQEAAFRALMLLGLGHASALFPNGLHDDLRKQTSQMTITGLSETVTNSLISTFAECGRQITYLRRFADQALHAKGSLISAVALADLISTAVNELSFQLSEQASAARSLMQLLAVYERPRHLLHHLIEIAEMVQSSRSEVVAMTNVFDYVARCEASAAAMRSLLLMVLERVTAPWLSAMSSSLGLQRPLSRDLHLLAHIEKVARIYGKDSARDVTETVIPGFISPRDASAMLETCSSFCLLKDYGPSSDMASIKQSGPVRGPILRWRLSNSFAQNDLDEAHLPAVATPAISTLDPCSLDPYEDLPSLITRLDCSVSQIEQLPQSLEVSQKRIVTALKAALDTGATLELRVSAYPLPLAPHFSFSSVIDQQRRKLGRQCLHMLLRKYRLREHLSVHYRYSLFGDGTFAARLSQALFLNTLPESEQRMNSSLPGSTGLQLDGRSAWPPGGAELRLALAGILSQSYFALNTQTDGRDRRLPGDLSFAVRNLTEAEIATTMNPQSLGALDFLRLQYNSSAPLDMILTENVLEKYDAIFRLLLRVARLLAITAQMVPRGRGSISEHPLCTRFRILASRFIEVLSSFFLQSAIAQPWAAFEAQVEELDRTFDLTDNGDTPGSIASIADLRAAHERALDSILFGLFLRQRQAAVMHLLEEIFTLILDFHHRPHLQAPAIDHASTAMQEMRTLYQTFHSKIATFVQVCAGLRSAEPRSVKTHARGRGRAESMPADIEELLLRLDMNGWWSRQ